MKYPELKVGQVFSIPLLGGGYAFGYVTYFGKMHQGLFNRANIFDYYSDNNRPDKSILDKPIALYDIAFGEEFVLTPKSSAGGRWEPLELFVEGNVQPHTRYYRMGMPPFRIDILEEDSKVPLTDEEAEGYDFMFIDFAPFPTAQVEVIVKKLDIDEIELIKQWRKSAATTSDASTDVRAPRKRRRPMEVDIIITIEDDFPSSDELAVRHRLEDAIVEQKLGKITDAGAGMGAMDLALRVPSGAKLKKLKALLEEQGLADRTKLKVDGEESAIK